jgi:hypothetical protein
MAQARQQLLEGELAYKTMILDLAAALNLDWNTLTGYFQQGPLGPEVLRGIP